jgi:hypothetical protein
MDEALQILRDARAILAEADLCKRAYARRANGLPCKPTDPRAVSYCMIGVVCAAAGLETESPWICHVAEESAIMEAICDLGAAAGRTVRKVPTYNNRWWRTKRGVLRKFDQAIAYREAEQVPQIQLVESKVNERSPA